MLSDVVAYHNRSFYAGCSPRIVLNRVFHVKDEGVDEQQTDHCLTTLNMTQATNQMFLQCVERPRIFLARVHFDEHSY